MRLWFVKESPKARLYKKHDRPSIAEDDYLWVPKSIIEHTTKRGNEHEVTLPDWYIEKEGL